MHHDREQNSIDVVSHYLPTGCACYCTNACMPGLVFGLLGGIHAADYISVQQLLMVSLVYVLVLLITCCYARYSETAGRPLLVTLFTAAYSLLHTFDYA